MSKFTPGPWKYLDRSDRDRVPYFEIMAGKGIYFHPDEDGYAGPGFSITGILSKDDACLIAAAPDLLEACKHVLNQLLQADITGTRSEHILKQAIAKAEGKNADLQ